MYIKLLVVMLVLGLLSYMFVTERFNPFRRISRVPRNQRRKHRLGQSLGVALAASAAVPMLLGITGQSQQIVISVIAASPVMLILCVIYLRSRRQKFRRTVPSVETAPQRNRAYRSARGKSAAPVISNTSLAQQDGSLPPIVIDADLRDVDSNSVKTDEAFPAASATERARVKRRIAQAST